MRKALDGQIDGVSDLKPVNFENWFFSSVNVETVANHQLYRDTPLVSCSLEIGDRQSFIVTFYPGD